MIVVNLFGAPGSGKSTLALLVAAELKTRFPQLTIECPDEIAKRAVYDDAIKVFEDQIYLTGAQYRQVARCRGHVDIVVTDSPVLIGAVYADRCNPPYPAAFAEVCKFLHEQFDSQNYVVRREHAFESKARVHSEGEANEISRDIEKLLLHSGVSAIPVTSCRDWAELIANSAAEWAIEKIESLND